MSKDPYRYFRIEAQELQEGLSQGLLSLERAATEEVMRQLLRHAHTLKGAARVVQRGDIGDLAHQLEDVLSPLHVGEKPPVSAMDRSFAILEQISKLVSTLDVAPSAKEPEQLSTQVREGDQAIRIPVQELDVLINNLSESRAAGAALAAAARSLFEDCAQLRRLAKVGFQDRGARAQAELATLDEAAARTLRKTEEAAELLLEKLRHLGEMVVTLRLVPLSSVTSDLERIVRDEGRKLGKEVQLVVHGGDTQVDAYVLAALRRALGHLVRNCVAHGIETPLVREKASKPRAGKIEVSASRRGQRILLACKDDGAGLDLPSLREVVARRGLASGAAARTLDEAALVRLLLRGGVSTSQVVTEVAGRGVGLDAVRDAVEALNGEVSLRSEAGRSTTVELLVPISLSAVPALVVEAESRVLFVSLDNVVRTARVTQEDIVRDGSGEKIAVAGEVIPFLPLVRALNIPVGKRAAVQTVVVLQTGAGRVGIGVDSVRGTRSVVVRTLPEHVGVNSVIAGAAYDEAGALNLVLAPTALVELAQGQTEAPALPAEQPMPPILVVDDSLTTRMLEQAILESAGFEVDLATSAEEALEMAHRRSYGIFVVDVEMPGMNGFEFVATARGDPRLSHIPAILVTSRAEPADKARGAAVGACAYIVKSEFNQVDLLGVIRRMLR